MITHRSLAQKIFFDFFPPPRFLEMPSVGLSISDDTIRFAELKRNGETFNVGMFGEEKLPKGVIEEGYINNKEELKKILIALRKKHNLYFIRASLPEEKAYLFRIQIPYMQESDIRNALRFKIEENVPIAIDEAVFDYHYISEPKKGDTHIDLGVAVIHIKVVSSYLEVFHESGLIPLKLRIESQAIAHAVIPNNDPDPFILVSLQETKTILAIVYRGVIQFSSTLPINADSLVTSIQKNLSVSESEAEGIRKGTLLKKPDEVLSSIVNSSAAIRDEVQKLIIFWETHGKVENAKIKKIMLCGSNSMLGIDKYLSQSLNIPTEISNVWTNILSLEDQLPSISHRDSLDYASALGLALPYD